MCPLDSSDRVAAEATGAASRDDSASPSTLRVVARGATGGLVATVLMTLYRLPVFRALPPTAEFWARYVAGGEAEEYPAEGLLLHLLYGTVAGAVFGPLYRAAAERLPFERGGSGVVLGLAYGALLSLVGTRIVFRRVLGRGLEPEHAVVFHVGHVVYGLTLGTWLSTREPLGVVHDSPPAE